MSRLHSTSRHCCAQHHSCGSKLLKSIQCQPPATVPLGLKTLNVLFAAFKTVQSGSAYSVATPWTSLRALLPQSKCNPHFLLQARPEHGMTKASYLGAVLAGLQAHKESASAGESLADATIAFSRRGAGPTARTAMQPLPGRLVCWAMSC